MARIIYTVPVQELIGSVGGVTFQRNASGFIIRTKPNKKVNASTAQTFINMRYMAIVDQWHFLTQAQKTEWNLLAADNPHETPYSEFKKLNGFQQFMSNNLNLQVCGVSYLLDAPDFVTPPVVPAFTFLLTASSIYISFAAPFDPSPYFFAVYVTPPVRQSSLLNRKSIFLLPPGTWINSTTYDITAPYCALFNIDFLSFIAYINCSLVTRCVLIDQVRGFRSQPTVLIADVQDDVINFLLTVTNGSGSGAYLPETIVPIIADAPPAGQSFNTWSGDTTYIDNLLASSTFVTMPSLAQSIIATFSALFTDIIYGRLYNWYAATNIKNIAPVGWKVPTLTECRTLSNFLGGNSISGGKLKEVGFIHWLTPNTAATNEVGFNLRAAGSRSWYNGAFMNFQTHSYFWTQTQNGDYPSIIYAYNSGGSLQEYTQVQQNGYGIRLLKEDSDNTWSVTGNDGKVYPTITIGTQVWTSCNIAETKYRDGSTIPIVTGNAEWAALITGGTCSPNGNDANI